ncbi:MAG: phosphatase PAP2 family protein [Acidobacteriota bacterium]|nr:phosphatase PAP2 family protein [Acidobacteriota bacterium]
MIRLITAGDRKIMHRINRWEPPRWFRAWMLTSSRAGDCWLWLALGTILLLFGGEQRFQVVFTAGVSAAAGGAAFILVKRAIGRERPCSREPHCWSTLLPPDRFSFPSGHTIMAFAIAVPIGLCYPELLAGLIFCAMSVAASRVILGLHYVTDVLAGILIGCAIGLLCFRSIIPA